MKKRTFRQGALVLSAALMVVSCSSSENPGNVAGPAASTSGSGGASSGSTTSSTDSGSSGAGGSGGASTVGGQSGNAGTGGQGGNAGQGGTGGSQPTGSDSGSDAPTDGSTALPSGPITALTFDAVKQTYFELLAAGYKFVEAKGVNSGLPGRYSRWKQGEDPEFVTRNLEAMGAWLSRPERPAQVTTSRGMLNIEDMVTRALVNGTDPNSGVTWQTMPLGQLDVESGSIAWGAFLAGDRVLSKLTAPQKANLGTWLYNHTDANVDQNWNLFYIVTNSFLKNRGWNYNAPALAPMLAKIDSYYKGNGWYTDGATHVFDDYANTVFVPDTVAWSVLVGGDDPTRRKEYMTRVRRFLEDQPYFFGTEGKHPEFGRSTAYKMARLTGLVIAYYIDRTYNTPDKWNLGFKVLPESFTVGMLRRLVRQHLNYYLSNGALDTATGLLIQRFTGTGSLDVAEDYISPGSVYWAARAFGPLLLLAEDDPFFSTPEQPLPIEQADYNHWLATPGLLLSGTKSTGNMVLFNAGTTYSTAHVESYILKYSKFAYSSQLGFIVANDSTTWRNPDNAIQIGVGGKWGHRQEPGAFASQSNAPNAAVLSMIHRQTAGTASFDVRTILFVKNELHVRVHKVTPVGFTGTYLLREGGFAVGRSTANGGMAMHDTAKHWSYGTGDEGAGMVAALKTYDGADDDLPSGEKREGASTAHTRFAFYALPYVKTTAPQTGEITVGVLVRGSKTPFDPAATFGTVKSLVVDATKATITFDDGSSQSGTFLN